MAPLVIGRDAGDIAGLTRSGPARHASAGPQRRLRLRVVGGRNRLVGPAGQAQRPARASPAGRGPCADLPAYASLLNYGDDALVARNTAAAVEQGYRHVKLHEVTRSSVRAAQAAGGTETAIMLDTNCAWDVPTALAMADSPRGDGMYWLEEPVWPPEDTHGLARVRQRGIPIAAGENVAGPQGFLRLLKRMRWTSPSPA